ncbi:DUF302 domain-containing protein [Marinobacter sp. ANT_B65]|uniref:DUF302 domain-containing protein n=1 Tax=Marinobacter sp. ANT_B65 TaxID=2039467 RepID=UPI000BBE50FA|nr:DUF302 domain-containing protein [Marinobacter sp. ANT_B65]PCM43993.1 hypothetical protein CPA50_10675 [Marinobacter sp. ANT_B65]
MKTLKAVALPLIFLLCSGLAQAAEGLIVVKSNHSVAATADKLETVLSEKGMKVMNRIDHAAGAESAGLELRPTEVVIFGNPKVGSPLMQCAQSVAVDLPQKALVWEDESGQVWLGYNDPQYLKARHSIEGCDAVLEKVSNALANFAKAATH